jgi:phosphoglycolate phosphatase
MAIRGILFDKDGTLIDMIGTWLPVYREMLAEAFPGKQAMWEDILQRAGYDPEAQSFQANSIIAAGTTDQLVDLWWPGLSEEDRRQRIKEVDGHFVEKSVKYMRPLIPLEPILRELKSRGIKLGVATNDNEVSARNHVGLLGIDSLIDFVAGYDSVKQAKPAGDMVHAFCDACGLLPSEIAVVGDNLHDLEMAHRAGAALAIGVLSGNSRSEDFGTTADAVLASIAELPAFLERQ